ncbi:transposase [Streptomyces sp. NBC_01012]|uniref:transposase n=1 Tax=Streptomyces sp. NBC_01012 TaxID=2903717 RepID=UPI00386D1C5B|nr:transposase [Streptomyces sp. NBC_01012]
MAVLQFAEDLTDRQVAAMAVRAVGWKYALGSELTDTGFDASALSTFRARLADNGVERAVLDPLFEHCEDAGLEMAGASSAPTPPM